MFTVAKGGSSLDPFEEQEPAVPEGSGISLDRSSYRKAHGP
jgi:hypothetical protein